MPRARDRGTELAQHLESVTKKQLGRGLEYDRGGKPWAISRRMMKRVGGLLGMYRLTDRWCLIFVLPVCG